MRGHSLPLLSYGPKNGLDVEWVSHSLSVCLSFIFTLWFQYFCGKEFVAGHLLSKIVVMVSPFSPFLRGGGGGGGGG